MFKILKYLIFISLTISLLVFAYFYYQLSPQAKVISDSKPISHAVWDSILSKNVVENGRFDYKYLEKKRSLLDAYLQLLSKNHPNDKYWNKEEQLAYWLNAYNAFTVDLILKHYPLNSIKDVTGKIAIPFITSPWDIDFIKIENEKYTLNNLEHNILRQHFDEPRIHFGINCASVSCPNLPNFAFESEQVDSQLTVLAHAFLADTSKNEIKENQIHISKIFSWFSSDFTKKESMIFFLNRYANIKIKADARISYKDYDWLLNDKK